MDRRYNKTPCRHCRRVIWIKCRGLCWRCYETPAIRNLYQPYRRWSALIKDFYGPGKPPLEATTAAPGSPEKMAVLAARVLRGERLWHPGDEAGCD